jgi:DNA (cytosine-5)-methyltransferase 1
MNHVSLFSGIGGLDLAAHWAGFKTVAFVERDLYCQKVLAKHWPGVPIHDDVRQFGSEALGYPEKLHGDGGELHGEHGKSQVSKHRNDGGAKQIHLLSGGFPCQPFSVAGKRQGTGDERFLWDEMLRVIREVQPLWVLGENVRGLLSIDGGRTFGTIVHDLAQVGYRVGWGVYGACHVKAPHRRERVFIVANARECGRRELLQQEPVGRSCAKTDIGRNGEVRPVADASLLADGKACATLGTERGERDAQDDAGWSGWGCGPRDDWWESEPRVGRVAPRISNRVDRLRALGNAVVPAQVYPILAEIASEIRRAA